MSDTLLVCRDPAQESINPNCDNLKEASVAAVRQLKRVGHQEAEEARARDVRVVSCVPDPTDKKTIH